MSFYRTCPLCGAHLDPGESCDCTVAQVCTEARAAFPERFTGRTDREIVNEIAGVVSRYRQLTPENQDKFGTMVDGLLEGQKAPAGAANTGEGGAEQIHKAVSASHDTRETEELQA